MLLLPAALALSALAWVSSRTQGPAALGGAIVWGGLAALASFEAWGSVPEPHWFLTLMVALSCVLAAFGVAAGALEFSQRSRKVGARGR